MSSSRQQQQQQQHGHDVTLQSCIPYLVWCAVSKQLSLGREWRARRGQKRSRLRTLEPALPASESQSEQPARSISRCQPSTRQDEAPALPLFCSNSDPVSGTVRSDSLPGADSPPETVCDSGRRSKRAQISQVTARPTTEAQQSEQRLGKRPQPPQPKRKADTLATLLPQDAAAHLPTGL